MSIRSIGRIAGLALAFVATAGTARAPSASSMPSIALTFDDLPAHGPLPPGVTRLQVVDALIGALRTQHAPAFGFANGGFGIDDPQSPAVLAAWRAAGLPIGNHSFSHFDLGKIPEERFEADVARNEGVVAPLMATADWHWFRYPFLSEGDTPAKRDGVRAFLKARGYRIAAVTMSFGDFAWNAPYARCMAKGDAEAVAALEAGYLAAARIEAAHARDAARTRYGRDIPYVLLMHAGAFDARMLPRLLALYRAMGFGFTTLAQAERDPAYAAATDPGLPGPTLTLGNGGAPLPDAHLCA